MMAHQEVSVKRETVAPCMTCPLCHKLFRQATTIIECLHTFCRKCIYEKLSDEEMECCPICDTDLGCVPLEKLRPDHNLQDVRTKIFPCKRIKVNSPEVVTPVVLPAKRKERSLSSLVVSTPRISTHTGMTGRRSKSVARKPSKGSSFTIVKNIVDDPPESSGSPEMLNKLTQHIRQSSAVDEPSNDPCGNMGRENHSELWDGKLDIWKPLTCLVEAANRSKSSKSSMQGSVVKLEDQRSYDNEGPLGTNKHKKHRRKSKVKDEKNSSDNTPTESERPKKLRKIRQKARNFGEFRVPPEVVVLDAASAKLERKSYPIWFSLVASDELKGDAPPLPQISASYLRIKDGSIPVSFIQKYLQRKLDLTSEVEVDIKCMGQTVVPSLPLNNLVDLWLRNTNGEIVSATVGSSAKDFVMVLGYARRLT
ncbi:ring finger protein [Striga asiatica]|uniref:Ring finger protein n=1 Tax=Striga asiatica TaxID=4170 RepID=A0A5A7RDB4_STRAF|nr:ring finger protein [Striga asiatica]